MSDTVVVKRVQNQSRESNNIIATLFGMIIILACLFIIYITSYSGKYSYQYFSAYQDPELTELAEKYSNQYEEKSPYEYEISYIEFTKKWIDHLGYVTYTYQGQEHSFQVETEALTYKYATWINFEDPESIRSYIPSDHDESTIKSDHARNVSQAISVAHQAVRKHIEDQANWKSTFNMELAAHEQ